MRRSELCRTPHAQWARCQSRRHADLFVQGSSGGYSNITLILAALHTCYPVGVTFCFGNGFGTACPCSNFSQPGLGQGCENSTASGGQLTGTGVATVSNDTVVLTMSHATSNSSGIFFQATNRNNNGFGTALDDALICIGGSAVRLGTKTAPEPAPWRTRSGRHFDLQ
jgi:hypothetical protein